MATPGRATKIKHAPLHNWNGLLCWTYANASSQCLRRRASPSAHPWFIGPQAALANAILGIAPSLPKTTSYHSQCCSEHLGQHSLPLGLSVLSPTLPHITLKPWRPTVVITRLYNEKVILGYNCMQIKQTCRSLRQLCLLLCTDTCLSLRHKRPQRCTGVEQALAARRAEARAARGQTETGVAWRKHGPAPQCTGGASL
jgi:hypothetical protein